MVLLGVNDWLAAFERVTAKMGASRERGAVVFSKEYGCLARHALLDSGALACLNRVQILAASRRIPTKGAIRPIQSTTPLPYPTLTEREDGLGRVSLGRLCCSSCWLPVNQGSYGSNWAGKRLKIMVLSSKLLCTPDLSQPILGKPKGWVFHKCFRREKLKYQLNSVTIEVPFEFKYKRVYMPFLIIWTRVIALSLMYAILVFLSILLFMDEATYLF
ncbi:hypothetical protein DSO57_1038423 [Entomophthora muscae]|uniref:Uncharacterized protein n=1 Tax=Entomophthora muscae TaxID=34485 RepID=A0ACC2TA25_9FUNG|nr:hypothetical protein DSO57_1038423 [Entomophthora muscae]